MAEWELLLTGDLNMAQTVKDVNASIAKIQEKIVKLQLKIDTKALSDAGVILKGLGEKINTAQSKMGTVTNTIAGNSSKVVKTYKADIQEIEKAIRRVNDEIGKSTPKKYSIVKGVDENGKKYIQGATITYTNELGKTIEKRLGWVSKQVGDVTQKTFRQVSESVTNSSTQAATKMKSIYKEAEKLKLNLDTKKTNVYDDKKTEKLSQEYNSIMNTVKSAEAQNRSLSGETLKNLEERLSTQKKITQEIIQQQKQEVRLQNLGRKIGDTKGINFNNQDYESLVKSLISKTTNELNSHLKDTGSKTLAQESNVSLKTFNVDPSTGKAVATLTAQVESGKDKFMQYSIKADQASGSLRIFQQELKTTSNRHLGFMEQLKVAMSRIPIWMVGMTAFYGTLHFFQNGVSYVNEFNKALTQLSIVFNESQNEVKKYIGQFQDLGMQMGISTKEIAEGAVEFARQGLKGAEMIDRMETAVKYAKISNLDFNTSAKVLTATVNSMGVSADRASDVFSYLGDATATGADEIGIAMQKVGGSAGAIGLGFEKASSWIAEISSRTRESAETIGNSIKSIIARVQSLKEKGFDEEDGTQVNQVSKALATVGVQLVDAQGEFRNFGDVMDELGAKWGTLSNRQQAYIATTVAGSYQQSRFLNIMEGYDKSVELYKEALNSAGTANQKFNLYQQGTEAHLEKMKNAFTNIFQSSFDSQGINAIIDVLAGVGNAINGIIKEFGLLPVVVGAATGAFLLFGNDGIKTAYKSLIPTKDMFSKVSTAIGNFRETTVLAAESAGSSSVAFGSLRVALGGFKTAVMAAGTAFKSFVASMAPALLFMGVAMAIEKVVKAVKAHNAAIKEAKTLNYDLKNQYSEQLAGLESLNSEYDSLRNVEDKTVDQKSRLVEIQKELADKYGVTATGIDAEGKAYTDSIGAIDERIKALKELIATEDERNSQKLHETDEDSRSDIEKAQKKYDENKKKLEELKNKQKNKDYTTSVEMPGSDSNGFSSATPISKVELQAMVDKAQKDVDSSYDNLQTSLKSRVVALKNDYINQLASTGREINDAERAFIDSISNIVGQKNQGSVSDQEAQIGSLFDNFKKIGIKSMQELQSFFSENEITFNADNVYGLSDAISVLDDSTAKSGTLTEKQDVILQKYGKSMGLTKEAVNKLAVSYDLGIPIITNNTSALKENAQATLSVEDAAKSLGDSYDDTKKVMESLNGIMADSAAGKKVNIDTIMELVSKDASLISMFKVENGQVKINTEAIKKKKAEMIESYVQQFKYQKLAVVNGNAALQAQLALFGIEAESLENLAQANKDLSSSYAEKMKKAEDAGNYHMITELSEGKVKVEEFLKELENLKAEADLAVSGLNDVGDAAGDASEMVSKLKNSILDLDDAINKVESKRSRYAKSSKEYRAAIREEIGLLQDQKKLVEEGQANPSEYADTKTTNTNTTSSDNTQTSYTGGSGVKATGNIKTIIENAAAAAGIDASIVDAVAFKESTYNPNVKSSAGALGLMQLMPTTAKGLGVTNPLDATQNANAGAKMLAGLYKTYGSWELALAAYNGGSGLVNWAMQVTGSKDWNVIKNAKADKAKYKRNVGESIFKQETVDYVPKVLNYAKTGSTKTSTSNDTSTNTNTGTNTSASDKDLNSILRELEQKGVDISDKIFELGKEEIDSYIAQFDMLIAGIDSQISDSKASASKMNPNSKEYAKEIQKQIALEKKKQEYIHGEADFIRKQGYQSDELTQKVYSLKDSWASVATEIDGMNDSLSENKISVFTDKIDKNSKALDLSEKKIKSYKEGSAEYVKEINNQIALHKDNQTQMHLEADAIRAILKENEKTHVLSISKLKELTEALDNLSSSWWDEQSAIAESTKSLKELTEKSAKTVADSIKDMYDQQKDAILDFIDEQSDALEKAHDKEMDRIDDELEKNQELIDIKEKQLDLDKENADYQKDLADKTKSRQEIQEKINRLSLDDSLEAKAQLKDLIKQREDIDEEIADAQADHQYDQQKQNYEDQKEALKKKADSDKENWGMTVQVWDASQQKMVEISGKTYDELKDIVEEYKKKATKYFEDIAKNEKKWSDIQVDVEAGNMSKVTEELNKLKSWFDENLPLVGQTITDNITLKFKDANDAINQVNTNLGKTTNGGATNSGNTSGNSPSSGATTGVDEQAVISRMKANSEEWKNASPTRRLSLEAMNKQLASTIGATYDSGAGRWKKNGTYLYHEGGVVGGDGEGDYLTKLMNQMMNKDANEQVITALKGELFSPSKNVTSKFIPNLAKLASSLIPNTQEASGHITTYQINIDKLYGTSKEDAKTFAGDIMSELRKKGMK